MRLGQTPQGFKYDLIREAYDRALRDPHFTTTDDCGVVVKYMPDAPVYVVEGEPSNMKLTFPNDLMILDKFMQSNAGRRVDALGETIRALAAAANPGIANRRWNQRARRLPWPGQLASAHGATSQLAGRSTGLDISNGDAVRSGLGSCERSRAQSTRWSTRLAVLDRRPRCRWTLHRNRGQRRDQFHRSAQCRLVGAFPIFPRRAVI